MIDAVLPFLTGFLRYTIDTASLVLRITHAFNRDDLAR